MRSIGIRTAFAMLMVVSLCISMMGQSTNASLSGVVQDSQGAVIPNASVVVTQIDTGQSRTVKSGEDGHYIVTNLPIGSYRVSASSGGFKNVVVPSITLQVDQMAVLNLTLTVGSNTEQVTVTAETPLLTTDDSSVGQVVQNQSIESTPLNGRNFWQLVALVPGASYTPGGEGSITGGASLRASVVNVQINGTGFIWNGWLMDGADITEYEQGGTNVQPNVDALSEFKVFSANMPAEFGHTPNVVSVNMKSGTNGVHGTAYEFIRNDIIDAHNYFATTSKNILKRNQFGGTVGGPIKKDKVFYFTDIEFSRQTQGITFADIVPTDAMRTGQFSKAIKNPFTGTNFVGNLIPQNLISQQATFFLPYMPTQSQANFNSAQGLDIAKSDLKIDSALSASDHLLGRYSIANNQETDPNQFPALKTQSLYSRAQNLAFSETHLFGSHWLNEARASYYRDYFLFSAILAGTDFDTQAGIQGYSVVDQRPSFPYITLSGYSAFNGSGNGNNPKSNRIRTWEYTDNLNYTKGKHDIKFGGQMWVQRHSFYNGQSQEGVFGFTTQYTGDAFADYLLGLPATITRSYPLTLYGNQAIQWAAFIQDNYRINSSLTLNLGMRWEYDPFFRGVDSETSAFTPATTTGFNASANGTVVVPTKGDGTLLDPTAQPETAALIPLFSDRIQGTAALHLPESIRKTGPGLYVPRVGFAWRPGNDTKTVFRGAFGLFPIFLDTNMSLQWAHVPPIMIQQNITNPATSTANPVFVNSAATGQFYWSNPFQWLGSSLVAPNPHPGSACTGSSWPGGVGGAWASCQQPAISSAPINMNHTLMYQYSFFVERQILKDMSLNLGYSGNRTSHNQLISVPENVPTPGPGNVQSRRPFPQWGTASIGLSDGKANYNALQATLEKRMGAGVYALVSYSWAKCMDNGSVESAPPTLTLLGQNYGLCSYDITNNLTISSVYQLPFGKGKAFLGDSNALVSALVSGWELAGVFMDRTGQPFTPTLSSDVANTGVSGQWPDRIGSGKLSNPTPALWFDPTAFKSPAQYTYGNSSRDILRADGLVDIDATVKRTFSFGDSKERQLEMRFESFNLANHPTFSAPNATIGSSAAGKVTSTLNANRIFQAAAKIYF